VIQGVEKLLNHRSYSWLHWWNDRLNYFVSQIDFQLKIISLLFATFTIPKLKYMVCAMIHKTIN